MQLEWNKRNNHIFFFKIKVFHSFLLQKKINNNLNMNQNILDIRQNFKRYNFKIKF